MSRHRVFIVIMALACFSLVSPCLARQGTGSADADFRALIDQHNKALNAHDLKGVMETYSPDPNVVLMGTGPGEVYMGDEAIGGAYDQIFTRFDASTLTFKQDWILSGAKGNIGWFAVTTTIEGTVKNEKQERAFNMSGTMEKVKGKWRLVSLHFSRLGAEQAK